MGMGLCGRMGAWIASDDLFIPPNELNGAMQGDEVLVDEAPPGRDGRRSGRIARVLTRRNPTVVGIFHYARAAAAEVRGTMLPVVRGNYVTPLDERMTGTAGGDSDSGGRGGSGDAEGDAASRAGRRGAGAAGALVGWSWIAAADRWRGWRWMWRLRIFLALGRPAKGRVIEVLGPPDAFGVDVEIMIRKHHLPHVFPANVLAEASGVGGSRRWSTLDCGRRLGDGGRDFRGLPIVTIDGETARDFDDAVLVRPLANGNWELQVHIADVSHYVRPGTALDLEARLRGT